MSGDSPSGRFISEAIFGQQIGMDIMRSHEMLASNPDEIYRHVCAAIAEGDPSRARLQGLCRAIQKVLEKQFEAAR